MSRRDGTPASRRSVASAVVAGVAVIATVLAGVGPSGDSAAVGPRVMPGLAEPSGSTGAGQSAEDLAEPLPQADADGLVDVNPLHADMPLMYDRAFGRYLLSVSSANDAWRVACDGRAVPSLSYTAETDQAVDALLPRMYQRRFGLLSEDLAATSGYASVGIGVGDGPLLPGDRRRCSAEFDRRLEKMAPDQTIEGGLQAFNDFQSLQAEAANDAADSAEVRRARGAWREWMNDAGYQPTEGRSAALGPPLGLDRRFEQLDSPAMKATAVAYVRCAKQTGIVPIEIEARQRAEAAMVAEQGAKLDKLRAQLVWATAARLAVAATYAPDP